MKLLRNLQKESEERDGGAIRFTVTLAESDAQAFLEIRKQLGGAKTFSISALASSILAHSLKAAPSPQSFAKTHKEPSQKTVHS